MLVTLIGVSCFSMMNLDEAVDTSDVEEREFDASDTDYHSYFSPDKAPSNSGRATIGKFHDSVRQEGQPSPRKRVKVELYFPFQFSLCSLLEDHS